MKKVFSVFLAVCMLFSLITCAVSADAGAEIDGTWSILVPSSPSAQESFAANKLQSCIKEAIGAELPLVSSASGKYIAVGAAASADVSGVAENGYRITVEDGSVQIGGTGIRGTIAGVYRFLEEFCGRKVYTSTLTVLPGAESISVPADTDILYEPYFEYTDTDWLSPCNVEYSVANGLNGSTYRRIPMEQGGNVEYLGGFCHTMTTSFCAAGTYFETHPEYFALRDGERTSAQLCLTNPEVVEIVKSEVLALLAREHDPDVSLQIVSVTQNDNYNYCQCENCKAFEAAHGGVQSATMINFVNQIADAVAAAGYDNVAVDTFAYQYTRKAPTGIVPRDNVIVRLCTIECCFCHALNDPSCERNVDLCKDLKDWSEICGRIYVWDYTTNYANTCCVFPDFGVIQSNLQFFYEHNVKGVYEEGAYYMGSCNAEFGELRSYMLAKCLQDPYCDLTSEINGFLAAYYGAGWQNIRVALGMFTANAGGKDGHLSIYQSAEDSMRLTDREVARIDQYFEKAKAAAETEAQLANIKRSELSWRFWKSNAKKGEFTLINPDRFTEKVKLFNDMVDMGIVMMHEGDPYGNYMDCASVKFAKPNEWDMFEADESGTKAINFFGSILEKLMPLLTMLGIMYYIFGNVNSGSGPVC